jgi:hypothetical protein
MAMGSFYLLIGKAIGNNSSRHDTIKQTTITGNMKKKTKIKTIEMEIALANHFNARLNLIVPNISWGLYIPRFGQLHECDLLVCTKSRYLWECEIKVTKADLIKDKEKRHRHIHGAIKRLYFAIPEYLEDCSEHIPERAGIILVTKKRRVFCKEIRKPKQNQGYQLKEAEYLKLALLGAMRIWTLKKNLVKKQMSLF